MSITGGKTQMKNFNQIIGLLQNYKKQYGDCLVPYKYITEDGIKLGRLVSRLRSGSIKISADEKAKLDSLGFAWKATNGFLLFNELIRLLQNYKEEHGDCLVPYNYITKDGIKLGGIVNNIRSGNRKISAEEREKLNSLGFVWNVIEASLSFEKVLKLLQNYKEEYGNCLVPRKYITEDGIKLGQIVISIRRGNRKTNAEEKAKLDSLGFVWKVRGKKKE